MTATAGTTADAAGNATASVLCDVQHIIVVLSGKGGVGKSSVAAQLALSLAERDHAVGVLDVDLSGPSMPHLLGLDGCAVEMAPQGWLPVLRRAGAPRPIACMSIAFLLAHRGDSVVWRGPKKTAMIRQLLTAVRWGPLDFLIIDTPPGTSDEHMAVVEQLRDVQTAGAVVVTTPQDVATLDVRKELSFCTRVGLPVLGIVENMSGFVCPHCTSCTNIFSSGGGEALAREHHVDFLGRVPIDPQFASLVENQCASDSPSLLDGYRVLSLYPVFADICQRLIDKSGSGS